MKPDDFLSAHFKLAELMSPDSQTVPLDVLENLRKLANRLEDVRTLLGNKPIHINSGYRTVSRNRAVGGVSSSQHLFGRAADIVVTGMTPAQVYKALDKEWDGGLGGYSTFTHLDIWTRRRWKG